LPKNPPKKAGRAPGVALVAFDHSIAYSGRVDSLGEGWCLRIRWAIGGKMEKY
jgi:hypothetical protein